MNRSRFLTVAITSGVCAALTLAVGAMIATGAPAPSAAAAAAPDAAKTFTIDPVHTSVIFKIKHMNASNFYGTFNESSGAFSLGDSASVNITVKADSVETRNSKRNDHVKSPDFLSVKEFADITFSATSLAKAGDSWKGSGDLTLHGVKKSITVEIKQTGGGPGMGGKGEVAGIESTFTIKRSDFGMGKMTNMLGDNVTLIVAIEGSAK